MLTVFTEVDAVNSPLVLSENISISPRNMFPHTLVPNKGNCEVSALAPDE